ncbi:APC family permease [Ignavibacteriales bacterium]
MKQLKNLLLGKPQDINNPNIFHKISLAAFLAWVGLGADGLSSSAYGPDEAFRALGGHTSIAIFLAIATAVTVIIISYSYTKIIEHFPHGGGGYVVATKLLGSSFGVISGSALIVDYILTITVSIASGTSQVFSFLPREWHHNVVYVNTAVICILIIMNLRGVKESITILVPIFLLFVVTHLIVIFGSLFIHIDNFSSTANAVVTDFKESTTSLGIWGMFLLFANAYSRGAGTYTGIEAVSNGIQIMREPKVKTAKRTMFYMAGSLAFTASAILIIYLLAGVKTVEGKTLNAVMIESMGIGTWFVVLTLVAEALLLFVAAQTGFIDGPRVMSNMAVDAWLPHRFSSLSDRLTMQDGIIIFGVAALLLLWYTGGSVDALVTMYSINVFVTFSLTQLGMVRFWTKKKSSLPHWKKNLSIHIVAFILCFSILTIVVVEKFLDGAWLTVIITMGLVFFCAMIKRHYFKVMKKVRSLSEILLDIPITDDKSSETASKTIDKNEPVAVLLVSGYGGLGIHSILQLLKKFPKFYKQILFVSVGVIDSGVFKGRDEMENIKKFTRSSADRYIKFANELGLVAESRISVATDIVDEGSKLCLQVAEDFPLASFFSGKLVFEKEKFYQRLLHNETGASIQKRLTLEGIPMTVLPIRVWDKK